MHLHYISDAGKRRCVMIRLSLTNTYINHAADIMVCMEPENFIFIFM